MHDPEQLDPEMAPESADADFDREMEELENNLDGSDETILSLLKQIEELNAQKEGYQQEALRAVAEAQTARRRFQQQAEEQRKFATESLVTDLLPVLDNFERSLAAIEGGATLESVVEAIKLVDRQLRTVLNKVQLERVPGVGEHFDPDLHEAIATVEQEGVEAGVIVDEIEPGYKMSGKVIRHARVRVAK